MIIVYKFHFQQKDKSKEIILLNIMLRIKLLSKFIILLLNVQKININGKK